MEEHLRNKLDEWKDDENILFMCSQVPQVSKSSLSQRQKEPFMRTDSSQAHLILKYQSMMSFWSRSLEEICKFRKSLEVSVDVLDQLKPMDIKPPFKDILTGLINSEQVMTLSELNTKKREKLTLVNLQNFSLPKTNPKTQILKQAISQTTYFFWFLLLWVYHILYSILLSHKESPSTIFKPSQTFFHKNFLEKTSQKFYQHEIEKRISQTERVVPYFQIQNKWKSESQSIIGWPLTEKECNIILDYLFLKGSIVYIISQDQTIGVKFLGEKEETLIVTDLDRKILNLLIVLNRTSESISQNEKNIQSLKIKILELNKKRKSLPINPSTEQSLKQKISLLLKQRNDQQDFLSKLTTYQHNISSILFELDTAQTSSMVSSAYQSARDGLEQLSKKVNVEDIEKINEEFTEMLYEQKEIQNRLSEPISATIEEPDMEELEKELEELLIKEEDKDMDSNNDSNVTPNLVLEPNITSFPITPTLKPETQKDQHLPLLYS